MNWGRGFGALIAALLSSLSTLHAQSVPEWIVHLSASADAVALVTCESAHSTWDEMKSFIYTSATVRVQQAFKGVRQPTLTVRTLGGEIDGVSMAASHGATLTSGESAVLFLRRSEFGSYHVIAGGTDGKLPLRDGKLLVPGVGLVSTQTFASWLGGQP